MDRTFPILFTAIFTFFLCTNAAMYIDLDNMTFYKPPTLPKRPEPPNVPPQLYPIPSMPSIPPLPSPNSLQHPLPVRPSVEIPHIPTSFPSNPSLNSAPTTADCDPIPHRNDFDQVLQGITNGSQAGATSVSNELLLDGGNCIRESSCVSPMEIDRTGMSTLY